MFYFHFIYFLKWKKTSLRPDNLSTKYLRNTSPVTSTLTLFIEFVDVKHCLGTSLYFVTHDKRRSRLRFKVRKSFDKCQKKYLASSSFPFHFCLYTKFLVDGYDYYWMAESFLGFLLFLLRFLSSIFDHWRARTITHTVILSDIQKLKWKYDG